ncbi:MAG: hypothetical protein ACK559_27550, partial [bacterium]
RGRRVPDLGRIIQDHCGKRPAEVDVKARPVALRVRACKPGQALVDAAPQEAVLLDPLDGRRLGRLGDTGQGGHGHEGGRDGPQEKAHAKPLQSALPGTPEMRHPDVFGDYIE